MFVTDRRMKSFFHLVNKVFVAPVVVDDHVGEGFPLLVAPLVSDPLFALFGGEVIPALQSFHRCVVIHLHNPDL